jgi:hypothetical protein
MRQPRHPPAGLLVQQQAGERLLSDFLRRVAPVRDAEPIARARLEARCGASRRCSAGSGGIVRAMSFQAYLDNIEAKTGKTPAQFVATAKKRGLTESRDIIAWLKKDFDLGLGHARALDYVIRKGPKFTVKQRTGPHRDASGTLKLAGKSSRSTAKRKS